MFTKKDKKLFKQLIDLHKENFEKVNSASLKYKINITKENITNHTTKITYDDQQNKHFETTGFPLCTHNTRTKEFKWLFPIESIVEMTHRPEHLEIFGPAIQTIEKILKPTFKMDKEYSTFAPMLLSILHKYNVIRFETESSEHHIYFMINLNIPMDIDMTSIRNVFKVFGK